MSTMTPKVLLFTVDIVPPVHHDNKAVQSNKNEDGIFYFLYINILFFTAESEKLEEMIKDLSNLLTAVKHEQEYMEVREKVHRSSKLFNFLN